MDDFDRFVNDLQEKIFDEAREAYGDKGFDRWRNPRFYGKMPDPDGYGRLTDITGDAVLAAVGRLPEADHHCAGLAAASLQEALSDYMKRRRKG